MNLNVLAERMGISRASLFAYRTGKSAISRKALWRLQLTERQAGIALPEGEKPRPEIVVRAGSGASGAVVMSDIFDLPPAVIVRGKKVADAAGAAAAAECRRLASQLRALADKLDPPKRDAKRAK